MNAEAERELLVEYLASCARVAEGFQESCEFVEALMPMTVERIDLLRGVDDVGMLAFLKRYEQFEDVLQRTIKTIVQVMEYGKVERLTAVDVTNRGAKLGILTDPARWGDAVRTRNALAHEYPLNPEKRVAQVNNAWDVRETLNDVWRSILEFVEREKLA